MDKKKTVNIDMKQYGMVLALIAVFLIFAVMTGGKNMSPANINNLIMQNGYVVILAVGMLLCCLTGNIDLGVGSIVALCGATVGILMIDCHTNMWVAILAALAVGVLAGMFVGLFVSKLSIPPFIVTLATMKIPFGNGTLDVVSIIVAGIATVLVIMAELKSINTKKKYGFSTNPLWQVIIKEAVILMIVWFFFYKLSRYNGIPFVLVIMGVLVGLYHFITSKTVAGRQIYALGGNAKAAKLSGINTEKVFFWVYTNMGILSAIAGIVLSARNASATPKAGDGFEMDAIASCYIGGAATSGGIGTIIGAVVGAFIMGILNNGMSLYGWSTDIQKIVKGAVLLGAVTVDLLSKRKKG